MNSFIIGCIVLAALGLFILAWDWLRKSDSKLIKLYVLPTVTKTIFVTFKMIQSQGNNLEKDVIVANVAGVVYPQLPTVIRKSITQVMFQAIVDEVYLFIEQHCIKFSNLVEDEFSK